MDFKVGDIVKGLTGNGCLITNEDMIRARVIEASEHTMTIEILEHNEKRHKGEKYPVSNNKERFALIEKITKQKLFNMPLGTVITTNAEDEDYQKWIKIDADYFINSDDSDYCLSRYDINENLTLDCDEDYGTRIIKVEEPEYRTIYNYSEEAKEMTVAEIEKELGHAVKIIKEED